MAHVREELALGAVRLLGVRLRLLSGCLRLFGHAEEPLPLLVRVPALDGHGDPVRDRPERRQGRLGEQVTREHRHHADHPFVRR